MRILAIILNLAVLGTLIGFIVVDTLENPEEGGMWGFIGIIGSFAVVTISALLFGKPILERGFIRTYFKRRALEEQVKIDALKKDKESKQ